MEEVGEFFSEIIQNGNLNQMKVYKDLISSDVFFSEAFPYEISMEDACIEVKATYVSEGNKSMNLSDIQE